MAAKLKIYALTGPEKFAVGEKKNKLNEVSHSSLVHCR
jgi:hypothetical protein